MTVRNSTDYECGDGWRNLVDTAIDQIRSTDHKIQITEVKEKFGDLSLHYRPRNEMADHIVSLSCEIASQTCELCGSADARKQPVRHLLKTLCAKCVSIEKKQGPVV